MRYKTRLLPYSTDAWITIRHSLYLLYAWTQLSVLRTMIVHVPKVSHNTFRIHHTSYIHRIPPHSTSQKIREHKYVSYDAQLCPVIAKGQRAPNAQLTHQIVDRHHEELKSSSPDSQTLKNPV